MVELSRHLPFIQSSHGPQANSTADQTPRSACLLVLRLHPGKREAMLDEDSHRPSALEVPDSARQQEHAQLLRR